MSCLLMEGAGPGAERCKSPGEPTEPSPGAGEWKELGRDHPRESRPLVGAARERWPRGRGHGSEGSQGRWEDP